MITDSDPSLKYTPVGYIANMSANNLDIKEIKCKTNDYSDYSDSTSCTTKITVDLTNNSTGVLLVDISNDMNSLVDNNIVVPIIDGHGEISHYINNLPKKSRSVDVTATPIAYCKATKLKDDAYTILSPFTATKGNSKFYPSYVGNEKLKINDTEENGCLIYTQELTDGGNIKNRGKIEAKIEAIKSGIVEIKTNDYDFDSEEMVTPQYNIQIIAYIPYKEIS